MDEYVYIIFEERQLSCDRDYGDDGFMIIWDSEEFGRNLTTFELIEELKKYDDELYKKTIQKLEDEGWHYPDDKFDLNSLEFDNVFEFLEEQIGEGIFYRFYYQLSSTIKEVHWTEESAKKMVDYYISHYNYKNRHYYCKYRIQGNKPEVTQCILLHKNNKEDGIPPTNKLVGILPKIL